MLDNNNHNSCCNFAEQIVSFVYGEITDAEKSKFQNHLQNCSSCADEVAAFAMVRSSIQEWRLEDFAKISAPVIEIASAKSPGPIQRGRLESIRAYFSLSAVGFSAGFAAILLLAGLFWFFAGSINRVEIANNNSETNKTAAQSNATEVVAEKTGEGKERKEAKETIISPNSAEITAQKNILKDTNARAKAVPAKNLPAAKSRISVTVRNEKIPNKAAPRSFRKNNPTLVTYEEFQDTSLRLSDILNQVSLR